MTNNETGECIAYLLRHKLMLHGCTKAQAEAVTVKPYTFAGIHPVLAIVYVRDQDRNQREVHRVYDWDDLRAFAEQAANCKGLAQAVKRAMGALAA